MQPPPPTPSGERISAYAVHHCVPSHGVQKTKSKWSTFQDLKKKKSGRHSQKGIEKSDV